jgi:DNA-binding IclR family transcriptional regulator
VELEKTLRRGYAVDDEELEEGLRCIAVPLLDAQHQPVAAVSVSGPSFRVTAQKLPSIANHMLQCVRGISLDMGYISAGRGARVPV